MEMHLEFVVVAVPISNQSPGNNLQNWRTAVGTAAQAQWPNPLLTGELKAIIINFYSGNGPTLDVDNMSKPILDVIQGNIMDYEQQLKRLADDYVSKGFQVTVRPRAEDLPAFAKDFKVDIIARRGGEGVLVSVKKNRQEMAADKEMVRYARIAGEHQGWRYDFAILEAEDPLAREVRDAQEPSPDEISRTLISVDRVLQAGFVNPALVTAWATLEAAMRKRLLATGNRRTWGIQPRSMLNELYSIGIFSTDEFPRLEKAWKLRNEIAHGFAAPTVEPATVQFLLNVAKRLMDELKPEKQPA